MPGEGLSFCNVTTGSSSEVIGSMEPCSRGSGTVQGDDSVGPFSDLLFLSGGCSHFSVRLLDSVDQLR